ncbi:MAG TPA: D-lyxose/D-mannose family sugar isomerase [Chthonomonadales bacterium]|nr:D-lyxose/D-mannose family sugar isomerase [Chthonomonadales bacterium]
MISSREMTAARARALSYLEHAGIVLTEQEQEQIEIADFGLGRLDTIGLELITYINTSRCCAKELVLFPRQTCPEHWHPPVAGEPGKEETFRCRWGVVYLYVPGEPTARPFAEPPCDRAEYFTSKREIVLHPGEQYTITPGTPHWFQGGEDGAVVSEFSTTSRDDSDQFRDPAVRRATEVAP